MKNLITLLFVCALVISINAQDTGIAFSHDNWETTLAKAKEQNKIIFVDAFTTWCGPCKWMDKNVFTQGEAGNFYNEHFINAKIDMEKGEGILFAKAYQVNAYPSFLFIDAKGNMVHKSLGGRPVAEFIALGEAASDPDRQVGTLMHSYKEGNREAAFMRKYIDALNSAGMKEAGEVAEEYLASQDDWLSEDNIKFIFDNVKPDTESKLYKFMSENKDAFYKSAGEEGVDGKLKTGVLYALRKNRNATEADIANAFKKPFPEKGQQFADEYELQKLMYSRNEEDQKKFFDLAVKYDDKYQIDSWNMLNSIAWRFFELTDDPALLEKAKTMAINSIGKDSNYFNNDTLAAICYKLQEKELAVKHANIAIDLAKKDGADFSETEKLLEKINTLK